ncbi:CoA pyrophosphatase [Tissierella carlieri]|uniref:CoA pyrophosphatase n=1 Tax=Tissierella carlieri TaxID=689904 RepID=A0ABT1S9X3_9FIRM|nr:CoA pyrophosphatase [Tissierella carlieri]MBU5311420.1 CoA pyrophosphatase [Tissierella carlieri]MCQ4923273.1 CoA pyrophosphatase [Tissierella carlieri]MDU5080665.1 CoA pyrophosphatase [Bacillota bacterium]
MDIEEIREIIRNRTPRPIDIKRNYSVLIPIVENNNRLEIIYELRSKNLNNQPGEISFPGGEVEDNETFKEAAIRETIEELNIKEENINIIGELDYLVSYANITIHCFLGTISGLIVDNIVPNPHEVDHIFTVPLDFFLENEPDIYYLDLKTVLNDEFPYNLIPKGRDYNWRSGKHSVMFYHYKDYIIWGFTARMTKNLIDIIKGPKFIRS